MAKLRTVTMLAALGLAGAAFAAQTPPPPLPADPDQTAQSPDHESEPSRKEAGQHETGTVGETPNAAVAGTSTKLVGLEVRSTTGEPLGAVVDVTMDAHRQPEYAVISTGNDTQTAVPYSAVASMVKGNKVVMDRTRLQNSPQVAQSELRDKSNSKWRADADKYWSAGALRTATPGPGTDDSTKKPKDR